MCFFIECKLKFNYNFHWNISNDPKIICNSWGVPIPKVWIHVGSFRSASIDPQVMLCLDKGCTLFGMCHVFTLMLNSIPCWTFKLISYWKRHLLLIFRNQSQAQVKVATLYITWRKVLMPLLKLWYFVWKPHVSWITFLGWAFASFLTWSYLFILGLTPWSFKHSSLLWCKGCDTTFVSCRWL